MKRLVLYPVFCTLCFFNFFVSLPLSAQAVQSNQSAQGSASSTLSPPGFPTSPSMPSVSSPELGNGFYVPGREGFYQGHKNVPSGTAKSNTQNSSTADVEDKNKGSTNLSDILTDYANTAGNQGSLAVQGMLGGQDLQNQTASLSASDLFSMSSLGLLQNFSGLINSANSSLTSTSALRGEAVNDTLLKKILEELEGLKASVKNQTSSMQGQTSANSSSSILRFMINASDMLPFCKTVFFSKPESDGTFLLTGDCKYAINGKPQTETFHLFFRATGTKNSSTTYSVTCAVFQSQKNTNSALYKLSETAEFNAFKTGKLVSLHSTKNASTSGANVDLLINLGE